MSMKMDDPEMDAQAEIPGPPPKTAPTMEQNVARLIELDARIAACESEAAAFSGQRAEVEEALKQQFVDAGIQNVKALGRTLYLNRSVYCSVPGENMAALVAVLDAEGMGDIAPRIATTGRIKALLKEDEQHWSERFKALVNIGEVFQIRNRSAS